jgi:hypothetical protein
MNIHLIGDSHVLSYKDSNYSNILVHHLGAVTAYKLFTKDYELDKTYKCVNEDNDRIVFLFGSIDCRIHIYNQCMKQQRKVTDLIKDTIHNYSKVLFNAITHGYCIGVHGVIPERQENIFKKEYYLDDLERAYIYMEFNIRLRNFCETIGIPFFDLYASNPDNIFDKNLLINKDYTTDGVHIDINKYPTLANHFMDWIRTW